MNVHLPQTSAFFRRCTADDPAVWERACDCYGAVAYDQARRLGLPPEAARDVVVATFRELHELASFPHLAEVQGSLLEWIHSMIAQLGRHKLNELSGTMSGGDQMTQVVARSEEADDAALALLVRRTLAGLLREFDATTWTLFEGMTVGRRTAAEMQQETGTTAEQLLLAQHAVLRRLRDALELPPR
jgi:hypothetical protein